MSARLIDVPIAGVYPITLEEANERLVAYEHRLGPVHRPFRSEAFALELAGKVVAVAVSASAVSGTIPTPWRTYRRVEVVELARMAGEPWAQRVMLRLWRQALAQLYACWHPLVAISYSHNAMHRGDLYRFDGWTRVTESAGKSGGGHPRYAEGAPARGSKSLWVWRYDEAGS